MTTTNNHKLIPLHILEILDKHSSENRKLSMFDIMSYLENEYSIQITRGTMSAYLNDLVKSEYISRDGRKSGFYRARRISGSKKTVQTTQTA